MVGGLEQPATAADDDRVTWSRYSSTGSRRRKVPTRSIPPSVMSPPGCCFSARISSGSTSARSEALAPTCCSVREKTIFGTARQMPANSRTVGGASGSWSAVGQYASMSS